MDIVAVPLDADGVMEAVFVACRSDDGLRVDEMGAISERDEKVTTVSAVELTLATDDVSTGSSTALLTAVAAFWLPHAPSNPSQTNAMAL